MLYMTYQESTSGGEICEGQENDPWPNHEDGYTEFYPVRVNKTADKAGWVREPIQVEFNPAVGADVWLVIVRYVTGGTFGRTLGCWHMVGAYECQSEADKVKASIRDGTYQGYKPWTGYFESLEDVEIHKMTVGE